ncbi:O-fucosyltransferase family protein [Actinidia rufa]|uniref:O-fucosyltransferase family protein n=1 Tax=Actinidia rufa TaxID=165716 RepID=A0A7J0FVQ9_9ERIC|nr:O-fucosyltransferase family protein [Actinidia rufa]
MKSKRQAYISVPSQIINSLSSSSLQSLLLSPKSPEEQGQALEEANVLEPSISRGFSKSLLNVVPMSEKNGGDEEREEKQSGFWEQPDGEKYLVVVVSGGINQQRNQIVDAVVMARILGATLVVPILQVNVIWGDESFIAAINTFDVKAGGGRSGCRLMSAPNGSAHITSEKYETNIALSFRRDGVLLLRGLDSRLSKDLPSDLQKLRCKVAFHGLKFATPILELGNRLTERMRSKGPYLALHLRMEKDVWEDLALPGELEPFASKASFMAAIDYIVAENSDVFMPSHGGNMGHAIQGHRAYAGHKKYITPNKRQMLRYFLDSSLPEAEFNRIIMDLHRDSLGQPELRTSKAGRDVTKYPVPQSSTSLRLDSGSSRSLGLASCQPHNMFMFVRVYDGSR